jgi:hypothetical protein
MERTIRYSPEGVMEKETALDPEALAALQFLDRHQNAWYCTECWAEAVGLEARTLELLAVLMATDEAAAAGYQARVGGPCNVCDAKGSGALDWKGFRSVQSLGKR